jgi:hypothetical protein
MDAAMHEASAKAVRKPYRAPSLTDFGPLHRVTRGSVGGSGDGMSAMQTSMT